MKDMLSNKSEIGEIVTKDFRTASVFRDAGIDFCCGGKLSLEEACQSKTISVQELSEKLIDVMNAPDSSGINYNKWNLGFLCDYIVNTHHSYVKKALPELIEYTQKISRVHGEHHPELQEVARLFGEINRELTVHLQKEENVLFASIKEMQTNPSEELRSIIASEIERMGGEHEFAGGAMDQISVLTKAYTLPVDACNSYAVCFKMLSQFEEDLHLHVHLENNILYKKALHL